MQNPHTHNFPSYIFSRWFPYLFETKRSWTEDRQTDRPQRRDIYARSDMLDMHVVICSISARCYWSIISTKQTMSLFSVAVLSKDNRPLYLKEFNGSSGSASVEGSSRSGDTLTSSDDLFDLAREASTLSVSSTSTSSAGGARSAGPLNAGIGQSCSIDQQFILHAALGRLEQLTEPKGQGAAWRFGRPNQLGHEAMWVGLVGHVDDVRLYAYVTTTKVKIIVACEDTSLPGQAEQGRAHDVALKNLMVSKSHVLPHRRNDIFPMFVYSATSIALLDQYFLTVVLPSF